MTAPDEPRKPTADDPIVAGPTGPVTSPEPAPPPTSAATPPPQAEPGTPGEPVPPGGQATPGETAPPSTGRTPPPARTEQPEGETGRKAGQQITALLAGAATLADKVRTEVPKRIREARENRVAGHCVIVTEVDGRQVVIGPYRDDHAAHLDTARVAGTAYVVALSSPTTYFATGDGESSTPQP